MRALLDVNVLIALLDGDHALHGPALNWFTGNAAHGWASCPITQNGCVRVMSSPAYPGAQPVKLILGRLAEATSHPVHQFWSDDVSLLDGGRVNDGRLHGPRQITDVYLLALAVHRGGRFVTFDRAVDLASVRGARPGHLLRL